MVIQLHKLSDEKHRLVVLRNNGVQQSRELEARSLLAHDFAHFALESVAAIQDGFWGLLAAGGNLEAAYKSGEFNVSLDVERAAVMIQSVFAGKVSEDFAAAAISKLPVLQIKAEMIDLILKRLRGLPGEWKSTPYGGMMELRWPSQA